MAKFRDVKTLQKFAAAHASIHNHFNQDRHLNRRDRTTEPKFLKRTMKRYGRPRSIVTDRLRSYRSAMKVIGNAADQECGRLCLLKTPSAIETVAFRTGTG